MDRNQEIVALRTEGWKLKDIADRFRITRERARQICARVGLTGWRLHPCKTPGCEKETTYGRELCGYCVYRIRQGKEPEIQRLPPRLPEGTPCPYCMKRPAPPYSGKCQTCYARHRYQGNPEVRAKRAEATRKRLIR